MGRALAATSAQRGGAAFPLATGVRCRGRRAARRAVVDVGLTGATMAISSDGECSWLLASRCCSMSSDDGPEATPFLRCLQQ